MKKALCFGMVGMGMLLCGVAVQAQSAIKPPQIFRYFDSKTREFLTYEFGKRTHVDRIAYEMTRNANALCWTAHRHYQGNPGYRITYKEMYKLVTDAEHIQKLVKDGYYRHRHDRDDIVQDLLEMDKLVDHVRDDVRYWHREETKLDPLRLRRFDTDDTVLVRLAKLEDTVHHLMRDYGVPFGQARPGTGKATAPRSAGVSAPRPR